MGDELGVEFSAEEVDEMTTILEEAAIDMPPKTMPHAVETIQGLNGSYRLAIITDTGLTPGHVLRRIMANDSLLSFFESFAFSNETLYTKPHPEPFLQVLDELEVRPDEAVHVGDLPDADVKGAKAVGMKTILFARNDNPFRVETEADACVDDLKKIPSVLGMLSEKKDVHRSR
jgi:putative hydrolase of the HAD superfamily